MAWILHPHWNAPLTPTLWLEIATYGLAPEAAARVRSEHLAHLEDARAAGESEDDVLREWGDPHRANDTFRKVHLTTTEALFVHPGYALSAAGWRRAVFEEGEYGRSGMVILLPLLFNVVKASFQLSPETGVLAALIIALAVPTLRWLVIAGLRLSGVVRVVAAWLLSGWGTIVALLLWVFWWRRETIPPDALSLGVLGAVLLWWFWRLWVSLKAFRKANAQTP